MTPLQKQLIQLLDKIPKVDRWHNKDWRLGVRRDEKQFSYVALNKHVILGSWITRGVDIVQVNINRSNELDELMNALAEAISE